MENDAVNLHEAVEGVEVAHAEFQRTEATYQAALEAYHATIRAAAAAGVSKYRISIITGITQPRVARILEAKA